MSARVVRSIIPSARMRSEGFTVQFMRQLEDGNWMEEGLHGVSGQ